MSIVFYDDNANMENTKINEGDIFYNSELRVYRYDGKLWEEIKPIQPSTENLILENVAKMFRDETINGNTIMGLGFECNAHEMYKVVRKEYYRQILK